ncbi:MAG: peptide ABC transporter substrate-binding protein, partial [Planctomycetes bacterium]|nr:peptide ABC transporter substrate-binding protein [Planctomycetota bacterium]
WAQLHDQTFDRHAAELETRFLQVGVEAPNDRLLVVRLNRPCPYFLDLVSFPAFLPCHRSVEVLRESYRGAPITAQGLVVYDPQWTKPDYHREGYLGLITNGPYQLSEWEFKRRARLSVNPHYWDSAAISVRTIDMLVYDNVSAAIMAYEAGDVDFLPAMDVPYDHEIARLARTGQRPDFHLCVTLATYFLNFNCVSQELDGRRNPFVDARIRKAFTLAVDREAIVNKVLDRGDRIARSFVPPGAIAGYDPPTGLPLDVARARHLLGEAGYPEGADFPPVILLYVPSDERVCQALARMWEDGLGIPVELQCKESKSFAEDKANHRYMIARGNWYADYYDPTTFLDCLVTGNGNNDSGFSNGQYDELLAQAGVTADPTVRADILRRAERIIVEKDCPILPILHYAQPVAIKPYVHGLFPNSRLRFPFKYVRVER